MKKLFLLIKRFIPGYSRFVIFNFVLNIIATILNLFSFATLIPILQLLFGMQTETHSFIEWGVNEGFGGFVDTLQNNAYYWLETQISIYGASIALAWLGVFLVSATFLKTAATFAAASSLVPVRTGVIRDLRNKVYAKMVSLPIAYFTEERKGDLLSRMTSDMAEVEASIMSSIETIFKNPIMILVYIIVLFSLSWQLTLFAMVLLPISGLLIGRIGRALKYNSLVGQEKTGEMMSQVEESLSGLRIIKAFNAEEKQKNRFGKLTDEIKRIYSLVHTRYLMAHPVSEFLGTVVVAILLWFGGSLILSNESTLSAPEFIYYLVLFYSIIQPFKDLSKATYSVQKGLASLQRIDEILDAKDTLEEKEDAVELSKFDSKIEIKNLWFKYQEKWILENINLEIPKGKMVALVGQSGSGKTTLVDLVPRFWDIQKGTICIDGVDVKDAKVADLRSLMGNVNQEAILFNDTFYNNITFGVDNATQEEVEAAAKIANAHDFIKASVSGYQTNIGDRGSRLSGGQRQRISIARAILKNPPILILDEATSALDTESERLVQEAIEHLMKNRTSLVIAHRLSTIRNADEICVMHEGRIVERGTHNELLALGGYYTKLCEMQQF